MPKRLVEERLKSLDGNLRDTKNAAKRTSVQGSMHRNGQRIAARTNHSHVTALLARAAIPKLLQRGDTFST